MLIPNWLSRITTRHARHRRRAHDPSGRRTPQGWLIQPSIAHSPDVLEDRTLLAGVTLITHGFQLLENYPPWVDGMASAIATRIGETLSTDSVARYHITVDGSNRIEHKSGTPTADSAETSEVVISLDWSALSNHGLSPIATSVIGRTVANALVTPFPDIGVTNPLAELPIHLIGHSRGASLMGSLAEDLGEFGIWVDQLTLLDTHPVAPFDWGNGLPGSDFPVVENVVFADSYWRADGIDFDFDGESVSGAYDVRLSEFTLNGEGYTSEHSDVHLWYHGTIDTEDNIDNGDEDVEPAPFNPSDFGWYDGHDMSGDPRGPRAETGFFFSRISDGDRPSSGTSRSLGGDGVRHSISIHTEDKWSSLVSLDADASDEIVSVGEDVNVEFFWHDYDSTTTLTLFLDGDQNPYTTGDQRAIGSPLLLGQTRDGLDFGRHSASTAGIASGTYFLFAKIDDGDRARYEYAPGTVTVVDSTNGRPVLTSPAVSPTSGNPATSFRFSVDYFDVNGQRPDTRQVRVVSGSSSQTVTLTLESGSPANGTYSATTTLPEGSYRHHFLFDDGQLSATLLNRNGPNVEVSEGAALSLRNVFWSDRFTPGDDDSIPEPGERLELEIQLENISGSTVTNVRAALSASRTDIRIDDSDDNYGAISSGDRKWGNNDYHLDALIDRPRDVTFSLSVTYEINGVPYHQVLSFVEDFEYSENNVVVNRVVLIDDDDNDGVPESGEFPEFEIYLQNVSPNGSAVARDVQARIADSNVGGIGTGWHEFPDLQGGNGTPQKQRDGESSFFFNGDPVPRDFAGTVLADIEVTWSGLAEPQVYRDVPLFDVEPDPWLNINPKDVTFGLSGTDVDVIQTLTLRNQGSETVTITKIVTSHGDTTVIGPTPPTDLAPWMIQSGEVRAFDVMIETEDLGGQFVERVISIASDARNPTEDQSVITGLVSDIGPPFFKVPEAGSVPADQIDAYGSIIVWAEPDSGDWDIYAYDLSTQTRFAIATDAEKQTNPRVGENLIAWTVSDETAGQSDIFGYYFPDGDLGSGQQITISTDSRWERLVGVDGGKAAFTRVYNQHTTAWSGAENLWVFDAASDRTNAVPGTEPQFNQTIVDAQAGADFRDGVLAWIQADYTGSNSYINPRLLTWMASSQSQPTLVPNTDDFSYISSVVTNDGTTAWSGEEMENSRDHVFVSPPVSQITQGDTRFGDDDVAIGSGLVGYDTRLDGTNVLVVQQLIDGSETVFFQGVDGYHGLQMDDQLAVWVSRGELYWTHFGSLDGPELSISSSDISFSPELPLEGTSVDVSVTVHNLNTAAVTSDLSVSLLDGAPGVGGVQLGSALSIADGIPGRASATVTFSDVPLGTDGVVEYFASVEMVDGENPFNNLASRSLTIDDLDVDGPEISHITITESAGDGDGILEDDELIRVSWQLTDPSGLASTGVQINSIPVGPVHGFDTGAPSSAPYVIVGPVSHGMNTVLITSADNDASSATSEFQLNFNVLPAGEIRGRKLYDANGNGTWDHVEVTADVTIVASDADISTPLFPETHGERYYPFRTLNGGVGTVTALTLVNDSNVSIADPGDLTFSFGAVESPFPDPVLLLNSVDNGQTTGIAIQTYRPEPGSTDNTVIISNSGTPVIEAELVEFVISSSPFATESGILESTGLGRLRLTGVPTGADAALYNELLRLSSGTGIVGIDLQSFVRESGTTTVTLSADARFENIDADDEPGLEGWTVYVEQTGNDQWDGPIAEPHFDITGRDGTYVIADLPPGNHVIREVNQPGWNQTFPVDDSLSLSDFVASFPFNGNTLDESSNGHNATNNAASLIDDRFGYGQSAYGFVSGNAAHMQIPLNINSDARPDLSVSLWVRVDSAGAMALFSNDDGGHDRGVETFEDSGASRLRVRTGANSWDVPGVELSVGEWHHIAVVYDSSSDIRLYFNGTKHSRGAAPEPSNGSLTTFIGKRATNQAYLDGAVDDVRIYERTLSTAEIQVLASSVSDIADVLLLSETFELYATGSEFPPESGTSWENLRAPQNDVALTITDSIPTPSASRSLHVEDTGSGSVNFRHDFEESARVVLDYYVQYQDSTTSHEGVEVSFWNEDVRVKEAVFAFGDEAGGGQISILDITTGHPVERNFLPYTDGKWYHVTHSLDMVLGSGEIRVAEVDESDWTDIPGRSAQHRINEIDVDVVNRIQIGSSGGRQANAFFDDIVVRGVSSGASHHSVNLSSGELVAKMDFGNQVAADHSNQPPVNDVPASQVTAKNSSLVFSEADGNPISIRDVDSGGLDLSVMLSVDHGVLHLGSPEVVTITEGIDGTGFLTIRGSETSINSALAGLEYFPQAGFAGADALRIQTDDLGHSGGVGAPGLDDDTVAMAVVGFSVAETEQSTVVRESGTTDEFSVVLDSQPVSEVVLKVASEDTTEAVVDPSSLTFDPDNWDQPQTVTVTGVDDALFDGDQAIQITIGVDGANSDDAFDLLPEQSIDVTAVDNDVDVKLEFEPSAGQLIVSVTGSARVEIDSTSGEVRLSSSTGPIQSDGVTGVTASDVRVLLVHGGDGANVLDLSSIAPTEFSNLITVSVYGGAGADTVYGSALADEMSGEDGNDVLVGDEGNDTLDGGTGSDWLTGGAAEDVVAGGDGNDSLLGAAGDDVLTGGLGKDLLRGGAGRDLLDGGEGADRLFGESFGGDTLTGGPGDDVLDGGTGSDLVLESADVDFTLSDSQLDGNGLDALNSVEVAVLTTGASDNAIDASSFTGNTWINTFEGDDVVLGGTGRDVIIGHSGNDRLFGNDGNDKLLGTSGRDSLVGGNGNDLVYGGSWGGDTLTGGPGNDLLDGGTGFDLIKEAADGDFTLSDTMLVGTETGSDTVVNVENAALVGGSSGNAIDAKNFSGRTWIDGLDGNDRIEGGSSRDVLKGQAGNDTLVGNGGNDKLKGGQGRDSLDGGDGDDEVLGESTGGDRLTGGLGNDTLDGGPGFDLIAEQGDVNFTLSNSQLTGLGSDSLVSIENALLRGGPSANDIDAAFFTGRAWIFGEDGDDTVEGGSNADMIEGGSGSDTIRGRGGNDTLTGNFSEDLLDGGLGDNTLVDTMD